MRKLVFIAGMSGVGKSHLVARLGGCLGTSLRRLDGDAVHFEAARRAFPFVKRSQEYNWSAWPRDVENTMMVQRLLSVSIEAVHPELHSPGVAVANLPHFVADGAIFCNDWFRVPFALALGEFGHPFSEEDVHLLHLCPAAAVVWERIQNRAAQDPSRAREALVFRGEEEVRAHQRGIERVLRASRGKWRRFESSEDAVDYLRETLAGTWAEGCRGGVGVGCDSGD